MALKPRLKWTDFAEYQEAFSGWTFVNVDFEELQLEAADFIYADPPYDVELTQTRKSVLTGPSRNVRRKGCRRTEGRCPGNQATPRIIKLYKSLRFTLKFMDAPRRINCTGDRTPAREVPALRNLE